MINCTAAVIRRVLRYYLYYTHSHDQQTQHNYINGLFRRGIQILRGERFRRVLPNFVVPHHRRRFVNVNRDVCQRFLSGVHVRCTRFRREYQIYDPYYTEHTIRTRYRLSSIYVYIFYIIQGLCVGPDRINELSIRTQRIARHSCSFLIKFVSILFIL